MHFDNGDGAPMRPKGGVVRSLAISCLCALAIAVAPSAAYAEESDSVGKAAGLGAATGILSLAWAPLKICYATGGLFVGGLAYAFSGGDSEVAMVVITPATAGDYVVTQRHLRGQDPIEFFGRDPKYPAQQDSVDPTVPEETAEIAGLPNGW